MSAAFGQSDGGPANLDKNDDDPNSCAWFLPEGVDGALHVLVVVQVGLIGPAYAELTELNDAVRSTSGAQLVKSYIQKSGGSSVPGLLPTLAASSDQSKGAEDLMIVADKHIWIEITSETNSYVGPREDNTPLARKILEKFN